MKEPEWMVQIYQVSDSAAQSEIATMLSAVESLTIAVAENGGNFYVMIECVDQEQAWCIHRFVTCTDAGATLMDSSPRQPLPDRDREAVGAV